MKATARIATATAILSTVATSAFAASSASTGSGLLIWLFLGFLGLIVATQLVPALMLLAGIVQGVTRGSAADQSVR